METKKMATSTKSTDSATSVEAAFATDEEIEAALRDEGTLAAEHITVDEIRGYIGQLQDHVAEFWVEYLDAIRYGTHTLVYESTDIIIVADPGHYHEYLNQIEFSNEPLDEENSEYSEYADPREEFVRGTIMRLFHTVARRKCDYSWSSSNPLIWEIPDRKGAVQELTDAHLRWLMQECRLPSDIALDYLMVEWRGLPPSSWAVRARKDQNTVSENIRKARAKILR